jgi:hypothetical protein
MTTNVELSQVSDFLLQHSLTQIDRSAFKKVRRPRGHHGRPTHSEPKLWGGAGLSCTAFFLGRFSTDRR